ncbi:MAG: YidC/Oxa1 family membrane protein insertase [Candidatus Pacebacteria bacterium]|nr:YidC/Oxa1 family membrane protein insertase [Candidatus Paceibacterota bacterium]
MFEFIGQLFNLFLYEPILNFLLWLYIVGGSFGIAIIALTIIIRMIIYPLNAKALKSQKEMQEIQPLIKELQEKYKTDPQKQAEELIKLYKEKNFNPFASFFVLLIQVPVILALYWVIRNISLNVDFSSNIYTFINYTDSINPMFLGINLFEVNVIFAVIVAIAQFFQIWTMQPKKKDEEKELDQMEKMQNMMQKQMLIIFPLMTFFILTQFPSALGLYWLVITIISIIQQKIILKS